MEWAATTTTTFGATMTCSFFNSRATSENNDDDYDTHTRVQISKSWKINLNYHLLLPKISHEIAFLLPHFGTQFISRVRVSATMYLLRPSICYEAFLKMGTRIAPFSMKGKTRSKFINWQLMPMTKEWLIFEETF